MLNARLHYGLCKGSLVAAAVFVTYLFTIGPLHSTRWLYRLYPPFVYFLAAIIWGLLAIGLIVLFHHIPASCPRCQGPSHFAEWPSRVYLCDSCGTFITPFKRAAPKSHDNT
jgi:hypothetical protein